MTTLTGIPVGATLTATYWAVPGHYGPGTTHASRGDALAAAIDIRQAQVDAPAANPANRGYPHPERIDVDLRWKMAYPDGGGIDMVAERFTYDSLAEARRALELAVRYAA